MKRKGVILRGNFGTSRCACGMPGCKQRRSALPDFLSGAVSMLHNAGWGVNANGLWHCPEHKESTNANNH